MKLERRGTLEGRVLAEALNGAALKVPSVKVETITSEPAANGLRTVLKTQTLLGIRYLDVGGFPGRTVGLD